MLSSVRYNEPANLYIVSVEKFWQMKDLPIVYTNINNGTAQFD